MARPASVEGLNKKLAALAKRVTFLERALRDARRKPTQFRAIGDERDRAEREARREALDEWERRQRVEFYRNTPGLAERIRDVERRRNKFLRSRGLKPETTAIPKEFRKRS